MKAIFISLTPTDIVPFRGRALPENTRGVTPASVNKLYNKKQRFSISSLYSNFLDPNNEIFLNCDSIQLQPTIFKNETVSEQFIKNYGKNLIENCISFLEKNDKEKFVNYLNGNKLSICNMFIAKTYFYHTSLE